MKTPLIAIVGRPNVGKSTLFNRLIGKRYAVVADEAGTTRDRISHHYSINDFHTLLVDTGGLQVGNHENIEADVQTQAHIAIDEADLILFLTDASNELTTDDFAAADILRKSKKPVIFIANKCDNAKVLEEGVYNLYELGFGEPVRISAIHKTGITEFEHRLTKELKELNFTPGENKPDTNLRQICILGKPNAGKSSLINSLLGEEKIIVSDIAGTTRDSTDTEITFEDKKYNLIDTAGLRRRGKIERGIEKFSALRCIRGIERSEVVVLLIDGHAGITAQDCHIAQYALEEHKGLILAINKIDLLEAGEEIRNAIINKLRRRFAFVPWAKVLFLSAKNNKNTSQILLLSDEIIAERKKRVPTAEFNSFMQRITHKHLPTSPQQKKPKFMYASQVDINPPKFTFFFRNPKSLHFSYPRYLENEIRKEYGFEGTSLHLSFKNTNKEEATTGKEKKAKRKK